MILADAASPGPTADGESAVLSAESARLAVDSGTVAAELSCHTRGARVLLVGDTMPLMAAIMNTPAAAPDGPDGEPPRVVSGSLWVNGRSVADAEHHDDCGMAPLDPPLPPRWTALEYLRTSARLAGASGHESRQLARASLVRLACEPLAPKRLGKLSLLERRLLAISAAAVLEPAVLVIDRPLRGVADRAAGIVLAAIERASRGRAAIISVERLELHSAGGQLARGSTDVLLLRDGRLHMHSGPELLSQGGVVYALSVRRNAAALCQALAARGLAPVGGPKHFTLELPPGVGPSEVLATATATGAVVLACSPLW